jgi:hypothetical protein
VTFDATAIFQAGWDQALAERKRHSPSFKPEDYTATGRASAAYGGKQNLAWWADNGPGMVQSYADWRLATRWEIPEIDGQPAVELKLEFNLPGVETPIKGYIDRVFVMPTGELAIVDIKTGRTPEVAEQLGLYAVGLKIQYGYEAPWGYFWQPSKGTIGPIDLTPWTAERFSIMFTNSVNAINAGYFNPSPANNCRSWCGVSRYCAVVGGEKAKGNDPLAI